MKNDILKESDNTIQYNKSMESNNEMLNENVALQSLDVQEPNMKFGYLMKSGIFLVVLVALTFWIVFRNQDLGMIKKCILQANMGYLLLGVLSMAAFAIGEGLNIRRGLQLFGYKVKIGQGIKYAIVGFFFSSITPSATGGQPMQLYYMHKDKYNISHSSLALLIELASYQVVTIGYAFFGFVFQWKFLTEELGNLKYVLAVGIILNIVLLCLVFCAIFSKKLIHVIVNGSVFIVGKVCPKKQENMEAKAREMVEEYQSSAVYFKGNKKIMGKMLVTSFVQITALHSVPFWIYCGLGLQEYSFLQVITLQAILFIAVSVLPLPGTVGASESGFMLLFRTLFPGTLLGSAMVLSRGISFYICVIITGIILAVLAIRGLCLKNQREKKVLMYDKETKLYFKR